MALLTGGPPNDSEQRTSVDFNNTSPCMNHKPNRNTLAPPKLPRFLRRVFHHGSMSLVGINHTCSRFDNNNRKGSASSDGHRQAPAKVHRRNANIRAHGGDLLEQRTLYREDGNMDERTHEDLYTRTVSTSARRAVIHAWHGQEPFLGIFCKPLI